MPAGQIIARSKFYVGDEAFVWIHRFDDSMVVTRQSNGQKMGVLMVGKRRPARVAEQAAHQLLKVNSSRRA